MVIMVSDIIDEINESIVMNLKKMQVVFLKIYCFLMIVIIVIGMFNMDMSKLVNVKLRRKLLEMV